MKRLLAGVATVALLGACATATEEAALDSTEAATTVTETAPAEAEATPKKHVVETTSPDFWGDWGIDTSVMDTEVDPGDNFFMYVSGDWIDEFELPADKTRYGAFDLLREKSEQQTRFIIEDLAEAQPPVDTLALPANPRYALLMSRSMCAGRNCESFSLTVASIATTDYAAGDYWCTIIG